MKFNICSNDLYVKVPKALITSGGNELSKFSDTPGDASLEDLFRPLDKTLEDHAAEASTFASSSKVDQGNALSVDEGRNVLATKLRAAIAKKRMEHESGRTSGGDLLRIMMGVLKEDATNTDGLVRLVIGRIVTVINNYFYLNL